MLIIKQLIIEILIWSSKLEKQLVVTYKTRKRLHVILLTL
jgi:hypothetical protein